METIKSIIILFFSSVIICFSFMLVQANELLKNNKEDVERQIERRENLEIAYNELYTQVKAAEKKKSTVNCWTKATWFNGGK